MAPCAKAASTKQKSDKAALLVFFIHYKDCKALLRILFMEARCQDVMRGGHNRTEASRSRRVTAEFDPNHDYHFSSPRHVFGVILKALRPVYPRKRNS